LYSSRIIERNVERVEAQFGIKLKRYEVQDSLALRESLDAIRDDEGQLKRPLTKQEQAFVMNESLLSKYDFRYWFERYCSMEKDGSIDGGGIGLCRFSESQEIIHSALAIAEDDEYEKADAGEPCDGIRLLTNKARQMFLTAFARAALMHRVTLYSGIRGLSASVDDDKIKELYDRDKRIYNMGLEKSEYSKRGGLPWWMRPEMNFDVKAGHMTFSKLGSSMLYQFSTMGSAIGQGRQFDVAHMTELAYWPESALNLLNRDFFPTLPQSPKTLFFAESVSYGRSGWWYRTSKAVENGRLVGWRFCYIPWYTIKSKYRRKPPGDWMPAEVTQRHADMVWETSIKYTGQRVRLDMEQMYWWESKRDEYRENQDLSSFLTNYCATPEEGHQHSNPTAVSHETLERLRTEAEAAHPVPYILRLGGTRTAEDDWTKGKVPSFPIGKDAIVPAHPDELDHDPRGIVWMWEPPKRNATYVMGIDPTNGIIPWSRNSRREDDLDTDNGVIEIIRMAKEDGAPDVQVCEFAAPIDQESLGEVANLLGRIYGGATEDGECLAITEVHLGMGLGVIRKMMDSGYMNHFQWQHIDKIVVQNTQSYGWYASASAVRILWEKFRRSLALRHIKILSTHVVEELADCIWDAGKQTANAADGKHDDRIRGLALCEWVARSWGMVPEGVATEEITKKSNVDWQKSNISWENMQEEMEAQVEEWLDDPLDAIARGTGAR